MNELMNESLNESNIINKSTKGWMKEGIRGWNNERMNERMNEWMNEWINELLQLSLNQQI